MLGNLWLPDFAIIRAFYQPLSQNAMSQLTFAEAEYEHKKRKTRREVFLEKLDQFATLEGAGSRLRSITPPRWRTDRPWRPLSSIAAHSCHADHLNTVIRRPGEGALVQQIHESMRRFAEGFGSLGVPDETTAITRLPAPAGATPVTGKEAVQEDQPSVGTTWPDGSRGRTPASLMRRLSKRPARRRTKVRKRLVIPEMHQTKKRGNQWHFWHEVPYWRR